MQWFILSWFLTLGAVPTPDGCIEFGNGAVMALASEPYYTTELGVRAEAWGFLRAWGSVDVSEYHDAGLAFLPFEAAFVAGASVFWGPLELAIEHECDHPVVYRRGQYPLIITMQTAIRLTLKGDIRF